MRRLGRHSSTVAAGLSLALCVATIALCVRSHYRSDVVSYGMPYGRWGWQSGTNVDALSVEYVRSGWLTPGFRHESVAALARASPWQAMWFGFDRNRFHTAIRIPLWSLALLTAPLPIAWVSRRRSRSASGRGFCVQPSGAEGGL